MPKFSPALAAKLSWLCVATCLTGAASAGDHPPHRPPCSIGHYVRVIEDGKVIATIRVRDGHAVCFHGALRSWPGVEDTLEVILDTLRARPTAPSMGAD